MPQWKAIVVNQEKLNAHGMSEIIFDVYEGDELKFSHQSILVGAGEEKDKIIQELQRHKNESEQFLSMAPNTEILLP